MREAFASLAGKLLVAMPSMPDPRFQKSVIFITTHDKDGAMGLMLTQTIADMTLGELYEQIGTTGHFGTDINVLQGGPVDITQGFLLHTSDYETDGTTKIDERFSVSATLQALKDYADGHGAKDMVFVLGYAGWGAGQLERELLDTGWLVVESTHELLFNTDAEQRWVRTMTRYGINPAHISDQAGNA